MATPQSPDKIKERTSEIVRTILADKNQARDFLCFTGLKTGRTHPEMAQSALEAAALSLAHQEALKRKTTLPNELYKAVCDSLDTLIADGATVQGVLR